MKYRRSQSFDTFQTRCEAIKRHMCVEVYMNTRIFCNVSKAYLSTVCRAMKVAIVTLLVLSLAHNGLAQCYSSCTSTSSFMTKMSAIESYMANLITTESIDSIAWIIDDSVKREHCEWDSSSSSSSSSSEENRNGEEIFQFQKDIVSILTTWLYNDPSLSSNQVGVFNAVYGQSAKTCDNWNCQPGDNENEITNSMIGLDCTGRDCVGGACTLLNEQLTACTAYTSPLAVYVINSGADSHCGFSKQTCIGTHHGGSGDCSRLTSLGLMHNYIDDNSHNIYEARNVAACMAASCTPATALAASTTCPTALNCTRHYSDEHHHY